MPKYLSIARSIGLTIAAIALSSLVACAQTEGSTLSLSSTPEPKPLLALTQSEADTLRQYALNLINQARAEAGLNELVLDDNPAAQSHAEQSLAHCTRGHWGSDGMKPYMRYTLAGGEQYSSENVFAIDFCPDDLDRYTLETPREQIDFAMDRFLNSPGHRQNMLNPHHRKVGIGLTYRPPTIWFVQLFVGDYIEYESKPIIDYGILTLSAQLKNGVHFPDGSPTLTIYYDPPLQPLTQGQLSRTYCYGNGKPIARLRPPLKLGSSYTTDEVTIEISSKQCPNPYDIPSGAPPPKSSDEAHSNWQQARDSSQTDISRQLTFPWITADEWVIDRDDFSMTADIARLLDVYGEGVYTIVLWAEINGEEVPVSEYSIFIPSLN